LSQFLFEPLPHHDGSATWKQSVSLAGFGFILLPFLPLLFGSWQRRPVANLRVRARFWIARASCRTPGRDARDITFVGTNPTFVVREQFSRSVSNFLLSKMKFFFRE